MIITINNETLPHEMHHIAVALQRIAAEQGYVAPVTSNKVSELTVSVSDIVKITVGEPVTTVSLEDVAPTTEETAAAYDFFNQPINTDHASIDDAGNVTVVMEPIAPPVITNSQLAAAVTNDNLDSAGLPWDARIHAGSRERNTDGSWRVRRRPKGVEEAEWEATLARVTAELRDLMEIPVSTGAVADAAAETALTDAEIDQFVDAVQGVTVDDVVVTVGDVVIDGYADGAKVTIAPPPIVAPPVTIAPPVTAVAPPITVDTPKVETFAQVMTFLTARTPKDEAAKPAMVAKVNEILAANGLTVLTQLGQRPELIPQVMTQFIEAFGE